jgi:hypothetical protein
MNHTELASKETLAARERAHLDGVADRSDMRLGRHESWVVRNAVWLAVAIIVAAFALRVYYAVSCYLTPQEALHFLAARSQSWHQAYKAARLLSDPPLFILALHSAISLGRTELILRMPSLLGTTVGLWFVFAWMRRVLGDLPALAGLIFLAASQAAITAATEVEQYGLLLCFVCAALYATERAFNEVSSRWAVVQGLLLTCALLTHYTAALVIAALGLTSLLRCRIDRVPRRMLYAFVAVELSLALELAILYLRFIRNSEVTAYLSNTYYQPSKQTLLEYFWMSMSRTFTYLIGFGNVWSHKIALVLFLIFTAGVAALLARQVRKGRINALLIVSPFVIGFLGALLRLFPFGGTRHQAYLLPFFAAGLAAALNWLPRGLSVPVLLLAAVSATVWAATNKVDPASNAADIDPRVFPISDMRAAIDYINQDVPAGAPLVVDEETRLDLSYFLGRYDTSLDSPDRRMDNDEVLNGHRIISPQEYSWSFEHNHPLAQISSAARAQGVSTGAPIWVVSVQWPYREPLSARIPAGSIRSGRTFGAISVVETVPE